jgi:hypothetical protein
MVSRRGAERRSIHVSARRVCRTVVDRQRADQRMRVPSLRLLRTVLYAMLQPLLLMLLL